MGGEGITQTATLARPKFPCPRRGTKKAAPGRLRPLTNPVIFWRGLFFVRWSDAVEWGGLLPQAAGASDAAAERAIFFMFCAAAAIRH